MKTPIYHNSNEYSDAVDELKYNGISLDATGLDGYLSIKPHSDKAWLAHADTQSVIDQIINPLCDKFGWEPKHLAWQDLFDLILANGQGKTIDI